jgi:RHS repeat-associated protein
MRIQRSSFAVLASILGFVAVATTSSPSFAQTQFPPWCSPQGTTPCSSMIPKEVQYSHRATCVGYPAKRSELAAKQDIITDYTRPQQCSLTVAPRGTWLTGGPWAIGYCGGVLNYTTLPYVDPGTGLETVSYKFYDIDWTEPSPSCGSSYHAESTIAKFREINCPPGMLPATYGTVIYNGVQYSAGYCQGNAGMRAAKNVGPCEGDACGSFAGNPIHIQTGNKYQVESDYSASGDGGIRFQRFYNYGLVSDASATIGADWQATIGKFWRHTYDRSIQYIPTANISSALAYRPQGQVINYNFYGGVFVADSDIKEKLEQLPGATGWKLRTPDDDVEIYSSEGKLLSITSRSGVVQTLAYSDATTPVSTAPEPGLLLTVTDSFGHQISFTYNIRSDLATMTVPGGGVFTYAHDSSSRLTSVTYPDTKVRTYVYNEWANTSNSSLPSALTGIIDEDNSRFATFKYHSSGRAIYSEHAGAVDAVSLTYNGDGSTTVTDALGTARDFTFTTVLGVMKNTGVSTLCPGCGPVPKARTYDANGNVTSRKDFNNQLTCYAYDTSRNLQTVRVEGFASTVTSCPASLATYTPAAGTRERKIVTTWHSTLRVPTSVTEANRTTSFTHDTSGNVLTSTTTDTSVVPNVLRTWTFTYNSFGQVLTEDGPRTDVTDLTTYTYYTCTTGSQCGQVNTITNAAGHIVTYSAYNAHGQPTQITDPNGLVTALAYDSRQRLTDRCSGGTLPVCTGGELTHLDYWPTGLLKKVTNPDASFIEFTYDAAHRLTQIQDGALNKSIFTLDAMGNRTAENTYDPGLVLKRTHSRVFNTLNQLWKDVNAAGTANVTTVFGYDANGNQASTNAPLSRNSSSLYDELNRLKQITDPNSGVTLFGYDANDNLTSITDPRTLVTSYTYTGFGDLKTQTSPDTGLTTNTHDSGGNLATSTDSRSAISTYTYDNLNRVLTTAYKIGSTTDQTITYTYDSGTNGKGHLTGASDANHSLAWTYDALGRVIGKGQTVGTATPKSIGYGYNAQGQLATILLPSGKTIQYGYNANGQVTSVTLLGTPNVTILSNVTYDPFGPITGWTWGNGNTATRSYDTDGKLTNTAHSSTVVGNRTFGYDDAFRITSTTDSASGPSWTLGYDVLDRLNSAINAGTTIGYSYDANGNRLTQTGTSASTYTVSAMSNRLSSTTGALARTYNYDNAGSVLTSGATTHTYYNNGRMKTARLGAASDTTYVYNALGQRVKKSGGGATHTVFFYDEAGHLVTTFNSAGVVSQEFVWLGDIPIANLRSGSIYYIHTDQLNTPRKITTNAPSPALKWKWDPTPFGEGTPTEPNGAFAFYLRFPGQYFDTESNLTYNYFRDFDPAIGRYVESDPIGINDGLNTYSYVRGNPVSFKDPLGLHVEMAFNRSTGRLVAIDVDTKEKVSIFAFSGLEGCTNNSACDPVEDTGPIPKGPYLIGKGYARGTGGDDRWYKLYGSNGAGGYSYTQIPVKNPATGGTTMRGGFNLHTGSLSLGCLTVLSDVDRNSPDYPRSDAYDRLKKLLDNTNPYMHNGDPYRGRLNVY